MPIISLSAFLKIVTKATPQKVSLYRRYLTPGGYGGFYRPLQDGIHAVTVGGEKFSEIAQVIDDLPREAERKHNLTALTNFEKWRKKYEPTDFFAVAPGLVTTPGRHLSIKLEPEFGATLSGTRRVLQIWYSKDVNLSKTAIAIGERLIEKHLCLHEHADCKAGILDLRRKAVLDHTPDDIAIDLMIASEFAWIDTFFQAHKEAAGREVA